MLIRAIFKEANIQLLEEIELLEGTEMVVTPLLGGRKVLFPIPTDSKKDILYFKQIIEEGNYKAVIDRTYSLEQIREATTYVETGEKIGNVVITF